MEHELKIWPQYYCRVADGSKTFEVRDNDRGFQPGDTVKLLWFSPETNRYDPHIDGKRIYPILTFKIGYVLPLDGQRVVFSLLPLTPSASDLKEE